MQKILTTILCIVSSYIGYSQVYNNEWIDYSKTYYKFKVGTNGLYQIPQSTLVAYGLGNVEAENFQLWNNGVQVPLYTSVSSGVLGNSDFLEFYGQQNNGNLDTKLYKADSLQMDSAWSLYTDTAAYYLTVNTTSANLRLVSTVNNVAGNTLYPENYFIYNYSQYYKTALNQGYGVNIGEMVYSSSYETAEGWASANILNGSNFSQSINNLYVYNAGPAASLKVVMAGNAPSSSRRVNVSINNTTVISDSFVSFNIDRGQAPNIPLSVLAGNNASLVFTNTAVNTDAIVIAGYTLSYPRQYNFGGATQFNFQVPASDTGNYLTISNFNYGSGTPVLYDLTNGLRLTGILQSGKVQFALPPSSLPRNLILFSTDISVVQQVSNFTVRRFVNYGNVANQGNYIIISDSSLFNDGNGNNYVQNYSSYRSSPTGGSYNCKIVDAQQLIDQFAFGVKHHPLAIRNFAAYALANFSAVPKYFFLVGKGLNYQQFRSYESDPNVNSLALVPTFGWPASDNLLTATRNGEAATIPIGRLSAISGGQIGYYLAKIKQYDSLLNTAPQTISSKGWMKNIALITGALSDTNLSNLINSYMAAYNNIAKDTLFGAQVYNFNRNSGLNVALGTNLSLQNLFSNGISLLTYFGHSSPNTVEFGLSEPQYFNNANKYPVVIINGCEAGDMFEFDTLILVSGGSLSEKYVFEPQGGSIAFIANSFLGLPTELNYFTSAFYNNFCKNMYGQSLGNIMQSTMGSVYSIYYSDYIAQCHVEEINLHGDPALTLYPQLLPDYAIQDSLVTISPSPANAASGTISITVRMLNIGKAINDSLPVLIQRKLPNNTIVTLFSGKIKPLQYKDSIMLQVPVNPLTDTGMNQLIVTLDPANTLLELSKANNEITDSFYISGNLLLPVWPYNYAIVHNPNVSLYASSANPLATEGNYYMELDTTKLFNSPLKVSQTITDSGGMIMFTPGIQFLDSTVYYWRVAPATVISDTQWEYSSFIFINNSSDSGFNQSHYYQYGEDAFNAIQLDSTSRKFEFTNDSSTLTIRTGLYPYYNWDQIDFSLNNVILDEYGCQYNSIQIVVYDSLTLQPWPNYNDTTGTTGLYGSVPVCSTPTRNFFEFNYTSPAYRSAAIQFLNMIPNGEYVSITNLGYIYNNVFINAWKADTATLGSGNSLWNTFHQLGLGSIDSFTTNLPFLFFFRKGDSVNFPIYQNIGPYAYSPIVQSYNVPVKQVVGTVKTPLLGPSKSWNRFKWQPLPEDSALTTSKRFDIIGLDSNKNEITLASVYNANDTDISFINAAKYPQLKLLMYNQDSLHDQPFQLKYWMLTGSMVPEGAVAPNLYYVTQDTLNYADTLHFRVAFKNIGDANFDSIAVQLTIKDSSGNATVYNNLQNGSRLRPLVSGDTVIVYYDIPVSGLQGNDSLQLVVNPNYAQPEEFLFNNTLTQAFYVKPQSICPGGTMSYSVANNAGYSYQWQVDTGTGYIPVVASTVYSGQNTNSLVLNAPPSSMYGYQYRCMITDNNNQTSYSNVYVLKFSMTWLGTTSNAWENPLNWSCNQIPDAHTDVTINQGVPVYPVISSSAVCRSLIASPNTSVTVNSNYSLDIKGISGN